MVDTNTLLSIGFAVISNFCQIVSREGEAVPAKVDDLTKYIVMCPPSSLTIDLHITTRKGAKFCVHEGGVQLFSNRQSYRELDDPRQIFRFQGIPKLSSNEALTLAERTIGKLIKRPELIAHIVPRIRSASEGIPFYWISWSNTNSRLMNLSAFLEIDARSGLITYAELNDPAFFDPQIAQQISNRVYKPDVTGPSQWSQQRKPPLKQLYAKPGTNDLVEAIISWKQFCQKLKLNPGAETEVASVNWGRSFTYTNNSLSSASPVLQVMFNNGTCFESIAGVAFSHYSPDACYTGFWQSMSRGEADRFRGKILKRWQDLAKELEKVLVERVGVPKRLMESFTPNTEINSTTVGTEGIKRVVIGWRNWPRDRDGSEDQTVLAFEAEFDVESGELKWINFHDRDFVEALRVAQKAEPGRQP